MYVRVKHIKVSAVKNKYYIKNTASIIYVMIWGKEEKSLKLEPAFASP